MSNILERFKGFDKYFDKIKQYFKAHPKLAKAALTILPLLVLGRIYFRGPRSTGKRNLSKVIAVVTGCTQGIGKETVRLLAERGARVILACRDEERTRAVIQEITAATKNPRLHYFHLDLNDFSSVAQFVRDIKSTTDHIDVLINNAGGLIIPHQITKDGFESIFQLNYLAPYLLTQNLIPLISKAPEGRIINVSSKILVQKNKATSFKPQLPLTLEEINQNLRPDPKSLMGETAYYRSKLALELYTLTLSRTLPQNVKVVSLHPGVIILDHARRALSGSLPKRFLFLLLTPFLWYFFKDEWYGAQTTFECVVSDFESLQNGAFYSDCRPATHILPPICRDDVLAQKLQDVSFQWTRQVNI